MHKNLYAAVQQELLKFVGEGRRPTRACLASNNRYTIGPARFVTAVQISLYCAVASHHQGCHSEEGRSPDVGISSTAARRNTNQLTSNIQDLQC